MPSRRDDPRNPRGASGPAAPAGPARPGALAVLGDAWLSRWDRVDALLYPAWAALWVIASARLFYGSMLSQTGGAWSAPLDDVFIHFDYARATARGYPFEWSEGNGFSSGNTSLLYPLVLAAGYWAGFRENRLMVFAAVVAGVSVLVFLLASARLFSPLGRWAKYLLPPALVSVGALAWSLWSGMENALHLGIWGLCLAPTLELADSASRPPGAFEAGGSGKRLARLAWAAGLAGAALFLTRPESVACVLAFGIFAAAAHLRGGRGLTRAAFSALRVGTPAALALVLQHAANRFFTGEWSANGAIAKLTINNPYMPAAEKFDAWKFHLEYAVLRNVHYHFHHFQAQEPPYVPVGWLVPLLAVVPLFSRRTRKAFLLVAPQIALWLALVALNPQIRWQNERYTMSAVAWLLLLAALGLAVLSSEALGWLGGERGKGRGRAALGALGAASAASAAWVFWTHQAPNMRDQAWFFGRASRNILDQHVTAGRALRRLRVGPSGRGPRRVLVGDAGALLYASDLPGLDLIGLGGYHDYPFARAGVHGLGASIELLERLPHAERPDVMALYPSWWGDLPVVFGKPVAEFPVYGNVICGGASKVIYRADWSPLDRAGRPRTLAPGERVIDELDVADLLSERAHGYEFPKPARGFVEWRVLPDPGRVAGRAPDLFDAGRVIPEGDEETARMRLPPGGGRLVARAVPLAPGRVDVKVDGRTVGTLEFPASKGWVEASIPLPPGLPPEAELRLVRTQGTVALHHVWTLEGASAPRAGG